jgi:hypothetical protein
MILDTKIGQSECYKLAELIVVKSKENIPIDVLSHWNFDFLLLVSLNAVDLRKYHEGKHLNNQY